MNNNNDDTLMRISEPSSYSLNNNSNDDDDDDRFESDELLIEQPLDHDEDLLLNNNNNNNGRRSDEYYDDSDVNFESDIDIDFDDSYGDLYVEAQERHRRRLQRRRFIIALLLILAFSLGLGIGLSNRNKKKSVTTNNMIDEEPNKTSTTVIPTFAPTSLIWIQSGQEIVGENYGDAFGSTVAVSNNGLVIAIGAPQNNNFYGLKAGHVRVYYKSPGLNEFFEQEQNAINENEEQDTTKQEIVKWIRLGQDIDGEQTNDQSGSALALSGNGFIVAIGSNKHNVTSGGEDATGLVKVYKLNRNVGIWNQMGNTIYGQELYEEFGSALDISDDGRILAISSKLADTISDDGTRKKLFASGQVRLYQFDNNKETNPLRINGTVWIPMGEPNYINGQRALDRFGSSISLSDNGRIVCVGSTFNNGLVMNNGTSTDKYSDIGHVRCYRYRSKSNKWFKFGQTLDGEFTGDHSGHDLSLSGDGLHLAIGATENSNGMGHVRVYKFVYAINGTQLGLGNWTQVGQDIDNNAHNRRVGGDKFGISVSLNMNGTVLAVGAPYHDLNYPDLTDTGHVTIYKFNNNNVSSTTINNNKNDSWVLYGNSIHGIANNDNAGTSVALSSDGTTLVIGAPFNDGNNVNETAVQQQQAIINDNNNNNNEISTSTSNTKLKQRSSTDTTTITNNNNELSPARGHVKVYSTTT